MNKLAAIIKIADIHSERIRLAQQKIGHLFPITQAVITKIDQDNICLDRVICQSLW